MPTPYTFIMKFRVFVFTMLGSKLIVTDCKNLCQAVQFMDNIPEDAELNYLFHMANPNPNHPGFDAILFMKDSEGNWWTLAFEMKWSKNVSTAEATGKITQWNATFGKLAIMGCKLIIPMHRNLLAFVTWKKDLTIEAPKEHPHLSRQVFTLCIDSLYPPFLKSRPQFHFRE
jgi:hypothetical protein